MADGVAVVRPPSGGIWRVGKNPDPLAIHPATSDRLRLAEEGHRFDVPGAPVLYFASLLDGCFAEVLAPLRPSRLAELVESEWDGAGHMRPGFVDAGWRNRRTAIRVVADRGRDFLDVEDLATHQVLRNELALGLSALGYSDLDVGIVRGPDRRVTQLIAEWAFNARTAGGDTRFGGIRYLSRLSNEWECWAVFPTTQMEIAEAAPIEREMPALVAIEERFKLRVF